MSDTAQSVLLDVGEDGVGTLTLNRPEAMNAITVELAAQLGLGLAALARESRAILIVGAGEHFCSGGDAKALAGLIDDPGALRELFETFHRACSLIATLPVPVVAAAQGYALAGGFELLQACGVVLVAQDAKLGDNHSNFGQLPGGGGSQRLPRLVDRQRALALLLTGDRLSGADAVAWGLAYRAVPADDLAHEARTLAARLAAKAPASLAGIKRLVDDGSRLPLDDALALEVDAVVAHISRDGVAALTTRLERT